MVLRFSYALPVFCWATRSQRFHFHTVQQVPYTEWWPLPTSKHRRRQEKKWPSLHHLLINRQKLTWWKFIWWNSLFRGLWRVEWMSLSVLQRTKKTPTEYKIDVTLVHHTKTVTAWLQQRVMLKKFRFCWYFKIKVYSMLSFFLLFCPRYEDLFIFLAEIQQNMQNNRCAKYLMCKVFRSKTLLSMSG